MPRLDRERTERLMPIKGTPPSLINVPPGCAFHPRCGYAHTERRAQQTEVPELLEDGRGHSSPATCPPRSAAHLGDEITPEAEPGRRHRPITETA